MGRLDLDIKDIAAILSSAAALVTAVLAVLRVLRRRKKEPDPGRPRTPRSWVSIILAILAILFAGLAVFLWIEPCVDPARYGFEDGIMGWMKQSDTTGLGITAVAQSTGEAKFCKHSLELAANLEGGHPNRSKGETFVEIPVQNLESKPITVWVYVPAKALGEPAKPNGVQVFVKDSHSRSEYGRWSDITAGTVSTWQQITLTPSTSPPSGGYMDPGFDPTQIKTVGVKVAIGDGSKASYSGPIYVDSVDWH